MSDSGLYIQLISVHGLIRGEQAELGRDADTGGQTKYVIELARALAQHDRVARVELLTRQVIDPKVDASYAQPEEEIGPGAFIVRLPCGPRRYLRKEVLWPYLDSFIDQALKHIRAIGRVPDVVHGHYADAGYVGARLAGLLDVPMVYTGHSLGQVKRQRLLEQGMSADAIEQEYRITSRIEAEEVALDNAAFVVASTAQEVGEQYSQYGNYTPERMVVIPPGVDLERFYPPERGRVTSPIADELKRFLHKPGKPMILAMSRPDRRKNIASLIKAYGESPTLQELANLVVVAGNRDDIQAMEKGPREILAELLYLVDKYDLYGRIAYPKHHGADDVPVLYRLAARSKGVFINPALTEPFGLTLIEAAATGLPVVAPEDGGPRDIIGYCKNGLLINPLDTGAMATALLKMLSDPKRWRRQSRDGIDGAHRYFSWPGHVQSYMKEVTKVVRGHKRSIARHRSRRLPLSDRVLICDIDNTLLGDEASLKRLMQRLNSMEIRVGYGVATGRHLDSALKQLNKWKIPLPDFLITAVGSEIHYNGKHIIPDSNWQRHIDYRWQPDEIRKVLKTVKGLKPQPSYEHGPHKISYFYDADKAPPVREIRRLLRRRGLHTNAIYSHQMYLDILPIRASKGLAVRYLATKWGFPPERILAAGDAGSDADMISGDTLGVVVANYSAELGRLKGHEGVFFAGQECAAGILEGMEHYDFFGDLKPLSGPDSL